MLVRTIYIRSSLIQNVQHTEHYHFLCKTNLNRKNTAWNRLEKVLFFLSSGCCVYNTTSVEPRRRKKKQAVK